MSEDPESEEERSMDGTMLDRDEDYVSVLSSRFSAGFTDDRLFFFDFRKPDLRGFAGYEGDIQIVGTQISMANVMMPPKAAKELYDILGKQIEDYEDRYGTIETDQPEETEE